MWPNEKQRRDRQGKRWNFHYWYDGRAQRLFFWDERKMESGVLLFHAGFTLPYRQIENLIDKLVADPGLRKPYHRELRFPLDRFYSEYGAFPEELSMQSSDGSVPQSERVKDLT